MKQLYVLVKNCRDGSYSIKATFNKKLIDMMEESYKNGELDSEVYGDRDGFHYETWNVPDECTAKNIGFYELKKDEVFY